MFYVREQNGNTTPIHANNRYEAIGVSIQMLWDREFHEGRLFQRSEATRDVMIATIRMDGPNATVSL